MADSAQARMTCFEVPGLMMTPLPHGAISAGDRAQLDDIYAGIQGIMPVSSNETCWIPSKQNTSNWINSKKTTNIWKAERKTTRIWVPEKEVVPCQD